MSVTQSRVVSRSAATLRDDLDAAVLDHLRTQELMDVACLLMERTSDATLARAARCLHAAASCAHAYQSCRVAKIKFDLSACGEAVADV